MGDLFATLADAEARLREEPSAPVRRLSGRGVATFPGRSGRPPRPSAMGQAGPSSGVGLQRAAESAPKAPPNAPLPGHLAESWRPRWLPIQATVRVPGRKKLVTMYPATAYSGLSPRRLWQALASGELARIRVPGSRRTLVDATDLDRWLEGFKDVPAEARRPGLEGA